MKRLKEKQESVLNKLKNFFFIHHNEKTFTEDKQGDDNKTNEYNEYLKHYKGATRWQNC